MGTPTVARAAILDSLSQRLLTRRITTNPEILVSYAHDQAECAPWELPVCLLRPRRAEEVQAVARACIRYRPPVVARGARTGLSGGATAPAGSGPRVVRKGSTGPVTNFAMLSWASSGPGHPHLATSARRVLTTI
ncbi:MAG: putative FAD-linked oxidoreductase [Frondihabitans sp.]|nr:putative FAD-linked oxidoreductase [Frondihabitans sp.]